MLISELMRSDKPLSTGGTSVYPYKVHLEARYKFTSRFGDVVPLYRVEGHMIHLPRALCPIGVVDARAVCVFRGDAPTDSDLMRPPVPISSAHRFRGMRPPL